MHLHLLLLALLQAAAFLEAFPQDDPKNIRERLFHSEKNPCGAGVKPECSCISDLDIHPGRGSPCPAGPKDMKCVCPGTDKVIDLDAIKSLLKSSLVESPTNPCGPGNEPICVCADGHEAYFGSGPPCPDGKTQKEKLPSSCQCPDGTQLKNIREMVERVQKIFDFEEHIEHDHSGESIITRIIHSDKNPCGKNIRADCTCQNGDQIITPKHPSDCDGGFFSMTCICPNKIELNLEEIRAAIREITLKSPRNPCGVGNAVTCTCTNGSEAKFGPDPCGDSKLPVSCSCPDGSELKKIKQLVDMVTAQFIPDQDE